MFKIIKNGAVRQTTYDFLLFHHCKYSSSWYLFLSYTTLNNIVILKSGLEVTQDYSSWYHSKVWVRFLVRFNCNYGSILHQFRDKARYWSKIVIFFIPSSIWGPLGGPHRNIAIPFGMGKRE